MTEKEIDRKKIESLLPRNQCFIDKLTNIFI